MVATCRLTHERLACRKRLIEASLHRTHLCYAFDNIDAKNKLYFGDNLKILHEYVPNASVDLIYLDPACARLPSGRAGRPPFNSRATYNVLFKEKSGEESAAQMMAFQVVAPIYDRRVLEGRKRDGDHRSPLQRESEAVYREIVESGPRKLADLMQALLAFLVAIVVGCSSQTGGLGTRNPKLRPEFVIKATVTYKALIRAREAVYASETGYQLRMVDAEGALDELEANNARESEVQESLKSYHERIKIHRIAIQQQVEIAEQDFSRQLGR